MKKRSVVEKSLTKFRFPITGSKFRTKRALLLEVVVIPWSVRFCMIERRGSAPEFNELSFVLSAVCFESGALSLFFACFVWTPSIFFDILLSALGCLIKLNTQSKMDPGGQSFRTVCSFPVDPVNQNEFSVWLFEQRTESVWFETGVDCLKILL